MIKSVREKSILAGLFLSKFDKKGIESLGLQSFTEAFNILAYTIGAKPASIKNYRDEFDPYFPNNRKGWHKREFRDYCKIVYDKYSNLDFLSFQKLIKSFTIENYDIQEIIAQTDECENMNAIAKRLLTGNAAEKYFINNYNSIANFNGYKLKQTTNLGCGFDFKMSNDSDFYCVEVKGLSKSSGNILFTEKEFKMAEIYNERFCLFVVKNFVEKPFHEYIFNPLASNLIFKRIETQVTQINYTSSL
ncbi:protein NO VEIN domain-containing protein [Mariniflexile maritimum]|uniref:protein NO VEIN domain-containing protein n=1 Tax=Mariniflexile maritimum TaxID=2682493 RepID=UPI0012F65700|nr:DUF3883 domain-containing protein [Mariniflexile maritimum]